MKEFKLSDYAAGDKIYMENLCVNDCQITGYNKAGLKFKTVNLKM